MFETELDVRFCFLSICSKFMEYIIFKHRCNFITRVLNKKFVYLNTETTILFMHKYFFFYSF